MHERNSSIEDENLKKMYGFNDPLTAEQKSIIEVAKILTDKQTVLDQLHKLEILLNQQRQKLIEKKKDISHVETSSPSGFKDYKFFSGVLYDWFEQNDFTKPIVLGEKIVSPEEVLAFFERGLLFKDQIARIAPSHGEWTHLLQWFILTEANKEHPRLSVTPVDLLKWIGKEDKKREIKLWDITFENPALASLGNNFPKFDARSVVKMFHFFTTEECTQEFPLLHHAIARRGRKYTPNFYEMFLEYARRGVPFDRERACFALKNNASPVRFLEDTEKDLQFISFLIDQCGMNANMQVEGESLLHIAIRKNKFAMAQTLIDKGANTEELSNEEQQKLTEMDIKLSTKHENRK